MPHTSAEAVCGRAGSQGTLETAFTWAAGSLFWRTWGSHLPGGSFIWTASDACLCILCFSGATMSFLFIFFSTFLPLSNLGCQEFLCRGGAFSCREWCSTSSQRSQRGSIQTKRLDRYWDQQPDTGSQEATAATIVRSAPKATKPATRCWLGSDCWIWQCWRCNATTDCVGEEGRA